MKNQPFHPRKIRIQQPPKLDHGELKNRTIIALNRLGQQRFSDEPGGYSLDNWARGMNILLDDFEEKMGEGRLPSDYFEKRRELDGLLAKPVSTSSIDRDISEVRRKMADTDGRIEAETKRIASRIAELRNEQARHSAELAKAQSKTSDPTAGRSSGSFFRRLVARNPGSPQSSKARVEELEAGLGVLNKEILEQQKLLKSVERRSPESPLAEEWKTLDSLQARLGALESERSESVQLAKAREGITASMADTISKIPS